MIRWLLRLLGVNCHVWKYRNPAARKCVHCGHSENYYIMDYEDGPVGLGWETVYPLAEDRCAF